MINNNGKDDPQPCDYSPEWEVEIPESLPPPEPPPSQESSSRQSPHLIPHRLLQSRVLILGLETNSKS